MDLVIWNEDHDGYRQRLQEQIVGLIAAGVEAHFVDRPGGIFVRHAEQIAPEDRVLFQSVARAIIIDSRGSLSEQINRRVPPNCEPPGWCRPDPIDLNPQWSPNPWQAAPFSAMAREDSRQKGTNT